MAAGNFGLEVLPTTEKYGILANIILKMSPKRKMSNFITCAKGLEVEFFFRKGLSLSEAGNYTGAIASYDKALDLDTNADEIWYCRGNALYNLGRTNPAIKSYDMALELNPGCYQALINRGNALDDSGRHQEAVES